MSQEFVKLVEREESALFVSLISRGFQEAHFSNALGWDYGVAHHRYEDRGHYISAADRSGVRRVILEALEKRDDFWADYIDRCNRAGSRLMDTANELGGRSWDGVEPAELRESFAAFANATMDMVPFLMATVAVQPILENQLVDAIASELSVRDEKDQARRLLPRLLRPSEDPDAVQEIRSAQRLADEAFGDPGLKGLIEGGDAAGGAIDAIRDGYPAFYAALESHVEKFGWLRTHGYRFEPLTVDELVERIAGTIGRWEGAPPARTDTEGEQFDLEDALGFTPSESLSRLIMQLGELIHLRFYRIDVHLQADCAARPMFEAIARHFACTRDELIFASVDELESSLAGNETLDLAELRRRSANWFELRRDEDDLTLNSLTTPLPGEREEGRLAAEGLEGMTASTGRASGPARVLFGANDVQKVGRGDVLVTTMTTPDLMLAIENSAAIVTDEGGILSHAAIISRELGIPCVIGTERATRVFADNQILEVDATQPDGHVRPVGERY